MWFSFINWVAFITEVSSSMEITSDDIHPFTSIRASFDKRSAIGQTGHRKTVFQIIFTYQRGSLQERIANPIMLTTPAPDLILHL